MTGVAGQDGVYLARSLVSDGFRVVGIDSPTGRSLSRNRIYLDEVEVIQLDLRDTAAVGSVVASVAPDEIYNLAALSSVAESWKDPERALAVNTGAVEGLVGAVLAVRDRTGRDIRLFQASSAEIGARAASPYARSKAAAEEVVAAARTERGLFAVCGVLHNHESPLRPPQFVTRKITLGAAEIAAGRRETLTIGNIAVHRDWGFASDYVEAMRRMLAQDLPTDLPIGTGVVHSLSDLLSCAFDAAGLGDPGEYVVTDPALLRPSDAEVIVADPEPARAALGWQATTSFEELVQHMVEVDQIRLRTGILEAARYLQPSAGPRRRRTLTL